MPTEFAPARRTRPAGALDLSRWLKSSARRKGIKGSGVVFNRPLSHATSFEIDELGRARKVTDASGDVTKTVWWGDGRVKQSVDGRGYKTQVSYDLTNKAFSFSALGYDVRINLPH